MPQYAMRTTTTLPPQEAEAAVREALAAEGFGVITEIDLAATLRAKLGLEVPPYRILGACRPQLAAQALAAEPDVGLLLPCNIVVHVQDGTTVVAALDPAAMLGMADIEGLDDVMADARGRLQRTLDSLPA
jgi:uncharacterized protein (DUF302 family)